MNHFEMLIGLWFKAGLVIFLAAIATIVVLLIAASPWLILIGLAIALIIHSRRQREAGHQSDLIDMIAKGAIGMTAVFIIGVGFVLSLLIATRVPWVVVFLIAAYWLWTKSHSQTIKESGQEAAATKKGCSARCYQVV